MTSPFSEPLGAVGRTRPRSAHLSAVWGRNRNLCVNVPIHGHLCVSCFGGCRRVAHRYSFICQKSVRNRGHGRPHIAKTDGTPRRPIHRTSGRDGPDQRGGKSLMSIHRSHLCHIGGADQGHFSRSPRNSRRPGSLRATQTRPPTAYGGWPSWPSRKAGFQPAGNPPAPPASPQPPFTSPTDKAGAPVAHVQAAASRRGCHRRGGRPKAGRTGGMVCDGAKQRYDSFTVSQTHDLRPNR